MSVKLRFVLVGLLASAPLACGDEDSTSPAGSGGSGADTSTGEPVPFDEAEVIAHGGTFATALVKINAQPFRSDHGLADMVNVYVDAGAEALYRSLDPEAPGEVALPEGTLVVKEHLDAEGAYDGYLMMYRGPAGYAPQTGDWFWARVDGENNAQQTGASGAVNFCIDCHVRAPSFVFGVAADNQT